jgi:hypothetical protein
LSPFRTGRLQSQTAKKKNLVGFERQISHLIDSEAPGSDAKQLSESAPDDDEDDEEKPVLMRFTCDGRQTIIDVDDINDNFCDCADGSDEPTTSACSGTREFYIRPNLQLLTAVNNSTMPARTGASAKRKRPGNEKEHAAFGVAATVILVYTGPCPPDNRLQFYRDFHP